MNIQNIIRFTLLCTICFALFACKQEEPNLSKKDSENGNISKIVNLYDGLGNIVKLDTHDDGSMSMLDDNGNKIEMDKDSNFVITTTDGEIISISHSILEDKTVPHDKWSNTKWEGIMPHSPELVITDDSQKFIDIMQQMGFFALYENLSKDSTKIEETESKKYYLSFRNTTCSIQTIDSIWEHTSTYVYKYNKYSLTDKVIASTDSSIVKKLVVTDDRILLKNEYYSSMYDGTKILINEEVIFEYQTLYRGIVLVQTNYDLVSSSSTLLSSKKQTEYFNFKRINEKQITISNLTGAYYLDDDIHFGGKPCLEFETKSKYSGISFELISF